MEISKKTVQPYLVEAHITLSKDELVVYMTQAKEEISQQVTVDGFRKGKAPKDVVEKQLNPELIRQEALEHALGDSFSKAAQQEQWDVMRTSDLKILKNTADVLEYSIRVHTWPALTLPDLGTISAVRRQVQVEEKELSEAMDTIRNMRATFLDKTGAAAQGDRVEVDFDVTLDGKPIEGGSSRNHPLIIGGKNFMPGFEEALVGLAAGDSKQFSLVAPDDYYEPKLAGKKVDFSVTVRRVQAVLKPEADDAFAKGLGQFESIEQLKDNLRRGIATEKQGKEKQRLRLEILDAIIAACSVPAPEELVTGELDDMVQRFSDDLKSRGIELPMYLARLKKTEEALRKDWKPEAERQVRIMLVLRAVAKDKGLTVLPEELEEAVRATIGELMKTGQLQEDQVDPERIRSALAQRILTDKTLAYLEDTCARD